MKNLYLLKWENTGSIIGIWNSYERAYRTAIRILKDEWRKDGQNPKDFQEWLVEEKWLVRFDYDPLGCYDESAIRIEQYRINTVYDSVKSMEDLEKMQKSSHGPEDIDPEDAYWRIHGMPKQDDGLNEDEHGPIDDDSDDFLEDE